MKENFNDLQKSEKPLEVTKRKVNVFTKAGDWFFARNARRRSRKDSQRIMKEHRAMHSRPLLFKTEQPSAVPENKQEPTLTQNIRQYLEAGNSITVQECIKIFHTTELRMVIAKIRKSITVHDKWETSENGKRYKRYYL